MEKISNNEISQYIKKVQDSNENFNTKLENIKLKKAIEALEKENSKIIKAKQLLEEYKKLLKQKDVEIESLKENNKYLYENNNKIPKFIKKIFIK